MNKTFYKCPGFYIAVCSIIFSLVANFVYLSFSDTLLEYRDPMATIPAFVGIAVYVVLLLFKKTSKYSPFILWILNFVSLLLFILYVYMYFSGVFYNGVTSEAIALIDGRVIVSAVFYILSAIASNVAIYLKAEKSSSTIKE